MYLRNGDQELSLRNISCIRKWLLHNLLLLNIPQILHCTHLAFKSKLALYKAGISELKVSKGNVIFLGSFQF